MVACHPEGLREAVCAQRMIIDEASMTDASLLGLASLAMQDVPGHVIRAGEPTSQRRAELARASGI